jgi:CHAT domain-containing protein/tetratricopeptide (TPR) repeat protein
LPAAAQRTPADVAITRAFHLIERRQASAAERLLSPIARDPALPDRQRARAARGLGKAYLDLGRRADASREFARALDAALAASDRSEAGWTRLATGDMHYQDGDIDRARADWDLSRSDFVAAGDANGEFEVVDDIENSIPGLERRPYAERCLAIAREQQDPLLEARARERWGGGLLDAGLAGPALIELERAASVMRPLGRRADPHFGDTLAMLGWALREHGAFDRAVPVHREGIRTARARGDLDSLMWNYFGLGVSLAELGHMAEAEAAARRGLDVARAKGASTNIRLLMQSLGGVQVKRRRWQEAIATLETAQAMPGVVTTAMPLVHLSESYRALGRLDEALDRASRAADLARRLGMVDNELQALVERAHVLAAKGEIEESSRALAPVIERLETYRASLAPVDFLKQGFGERFTHAYGLSVALMMQRDVPREALSAAERVRSRAFADLLAARRARETEDADVDRWLLGATGHPVQRTATMDSPLAAAALDADGLAALARRLESPVVIYWIHEYGSFVWVVRPDGSVHAASIPLGALRLRAEIREAVDVPPELQLTRSPSGVVKAAVGSRAVYGRLYEALWQPIEAWLPSVPGVRVAVIPHGPLLALPFGALRDRAGKYLIERFSLHYAASGAVLLGALDRMARPADATRALLVADPAPVPSAGAGARSTPLPGARVEVESIARMLAGSADVLVGRQASEAAVRAALPAARVAHFATHAIVDDVDPLGSHLVLGAANAATSDHDGRLTASEVAGMTLDGELVVLAACRSARGPISSDGIAGLTRAFQSAGVPTVLATLWDVSDRTTARVVNSFYREWTAGASKDAALRAAQLALIRDLRAGRVTTNAGGTRIVYPEHPWLWAAPILIGAP